MLHAIFLPPVGHSREQRGCLVLYVASEIACGPRNVSAARARLAEKGFDVSPVRAGAKPGTQVCSVRAGTAGVPTLLIGPAAPATDGPDS